MTPDLRFYFDGMAKTYRLQCLNCPAESSDLWRYDHALEHRHILAVAQATVDHVCGVA